MKEEQPIFVAMALHDMGWAHSKPYKREHAARRWAESDIKVGRPVILAKYANFEAFIEGACDKEILK
jgi:hypothetical protein